MTAVVGVFLLYLGNRKTVTTVQTHYNHTVTSIMVPNQQNISPLCFFISLYGEIITKVHIMYRDWKCPQRNEKEAFCTHSTSECWKVVGVT